jgi:hypothetical protein
MWKGAQSVQGVIVYLHGQECVGHRHRSWVAWVLLTCRFTATLFVCAGCSCVKPTVLTPDMSYLMTGSRWWMPCSTPQPSLDLGMVIGHYRGHCALPLQGGRHAHKGYENGRAGLAGEPVGTRHCRGTDCTSHHGVLACLGLNQEHPTGHQQTGYYPAEMDSR